LKEAPEPWDVNWQNLHFSVVDKLVRRAVSFAFTLVILGVGTWILLLVEKLGDADDDGGDDVDDFTVMWLKVLPYVSAIVTEIINTIIAEIIILCANKEAYSTNTRY
jgi:hypothetical protein